MARPDPVLAQCQSGDLVGVILVCPRHDCGWREEHGSAEVVNVHGVRDPLPNRCPEHGLFVKVERIVEVIGDAA